MPDPYIDKAAKDVPETMKQNIGKLIIVCAGETDPARKIHYTSALISHIRSSLFYIANNAADRTFDEHLHSLIYNILKSEYDVKATKFAYDRMKELFDESPKTKYYFILTRDIALIQQCRNNWKSANSRYFSNPDAWQYSNDILADIQDVLVEIANRWNLMIIPKDIPFNIGQIPNIGSTIPMTPLDV